MKDLFDFKPGWPTTYGGVRALKDKHFLSGTVSFAGNSTIERAGAILVGKTNTPVMGFRGTCDNYSSARRTTPSIVAERRRLFGRQRGGDRDGLLPLAEGTDARRSIRIPAAWCDVYGYKASYGRIPVVIRPNAFAGDPPFVFEGPITVRSRTPPWP